MIEKEYENYVLVCDLCDDTETFEKHEEAVDFAKENGWKFKLTNKIWYHYCESCSTNL